MSQITKTAEVKPIASTESYGRAITAGLALTAAILVVAFLLTRPMAAVPSRGVGSGPADRWLPAGRHRRSHSTADAACPGLVRRLGGRLIGPMRAAQNDVRDGWEAGLVGVSRHHPARMRDGWEAGLLPPAPSGDNITDGWESSLFR